MNLPGQLQHKRKPKNLRTKKTLTKNTEIKDNTVLDDTPTRTVAPPAANKQKTPSGNHQPYSWRASLGYMPADPIQKDINKYPPDTDKEMLRKNWTKADHEKNAKAVDKHSKDQQTIEARNMKQIIGTPEGNSPAPVNIKENINKG